MSEAEKKILEIQKHDFHQALARIDEFAKTPTSDLKIELVETQGWLFGWGDHTVTGAEFNERLKAIQSYITTLNDVCNKTKKEFGEVYKALNTLDKDYIASILINFEAIKKTSNDVRIQQGVLEEQQKELNKHHNKLEAHQNEIEGIVEKLRKTVAVLQKFKEKLDTLKHLDDVDSIWEECNNLRNDMAIVQNDISLLKQLLEEKSLIDYKSKTDSQIKKLSDKIKIAYIIAGGSLGLAVLEFILLITGVI